MADDHECRGESGWYDRRREIYADHQNRVIAADEAGLEKARVYNAEIEDTAAEVMAGDYRRTW
ncbi:hypothetical protein [Herbidospora mongoliensis]|uniref:hypothetical protein n=1 Tax=Herbidospora mongoliensis TaxID=688067 RepID=UPI0008298B02|nr:hypothetical protein [Herbidospora mongoliensis]